MRAGVARQGALLGSRRTAAPLLGAQHHRHALPRRALVPVARQRAGGCSPADAFHVPAGGRRLRSCRRPPRWVQRRPPPLAASPGRRGGAVVTDWRQAYLLVDRYADALQPRQVAALAAGLPRLLSSQPPVPGTPEPQQARALARALAALVERAAPALEPDDLGAAAAALSRMGAADARLTQALLRQAQAKRERMSHEGLGNLLSAVAESGHQPSRQELEQLLASQRGRQLLAARAAAAEQAAAEQQQQEVRRRQQQQQQQQQQRQQARSGQQQQAGQQRALQAGELRRGARALQQLAPGPPSLAREWHDGALRQAIATGRPVRIPPDALRAFHSREVAAAAEERSLEAVAGALRLYGPRLDLGQLAGLAAALAAAATQGPGAREDEAARQLAGPLFDLAHRRLSADEGAPPAATLALLEASARLRAYSEPLLAALLGSCSVAWAAWQPDQLAALVHALARLGVRPGGRWLAEFDLASAAATAAWSASDLERAASGLAVLRWPPSEAWLRAAEGRCEELGQAQAAGAADVKDGQARALRVAVKALAVLGGPRARGWLAALQQTGRAPWEQQAAAQRARQQEQEQPQWELEQRVGSLGSIDDVLGPAVASMDAAGVPAGSSSSSSGQRQAQDAAAAAAVGAGAGGGHALHAIEGPMLQAVDVGAGAGAPSWAGPASAAPAGQAPAGAREGAEPLQAVREPAPWADEQLARWRQVEGPAGAGDAAALARDGSGDLGLAGGLGGKEQEGEEEEEADMEEAVLLEDSTLEPWPPLEGGGASGGVEAAAAGGVAAAAASLSEAPAAAGGGAAAGAPSAALAALMAAMEAEGSNVPDPEVVAQLQAETEADQEAAGSLADLQAAAAAVQSASERLDQLSAADDSARQRAAGQGAAAAAAAAAAPSPAAAQPRRSLGHSGTPALAAAAKALRAPGPPNKALLWGCLEALAQEQQELRATAALAAALPPAELRRRLEGAGQEDPQLRALRLLQADFERFRQRAEREAASARRDAAADVVAKLLPLADSFDAALAALRPAPGSVAEAAASDNERAMHTAYQGLREQLLAIFRSNGVELVHCEGQPFDPQTAEAVMREASKAVPDGTVVRQLRAGYMAGERLLRPALVAVAYDDG